MTSHFPQSGGSNLLGHATVFRQLASMSWRVRHLFFSSEEASRAGSRNVS